jgi:endonuclease/exonuclease/phosphatase family metal-dependent hydrolase
MRLVLAALLAALLPALPAAAAELRLATWNIAWLTTKPAGHPALPRDHRPRQSSDFALLQRYAQRLDADVVAIQEVDGELAAARVFDAQRYVFHMTQESDVQRPGFAIRRGLTVTQNPDLLALDLTPNARFSLRRGADVTVQAPGGAPLRLLSVHLDSGCSDGALADARSRDCAQLSRQTDVLARWIEARRREGVAFAILGDFNRRLGPGEEMLRRLEAAAPLAAPGAGLSSPCWADARGGRPFIDHVLLGGPAREWLVPGSLRVMVYAERDPAWRHRISDHCPVALQLRPRE